jgi:hypothetical protein
MSDAPNNRSESADEQAAGQTIQSLTERVTEPATDRVIDRVIGRVTERVAEQIELPFTERAPASVPPARAIAEFTIEPAAAEPVKRKRFREKRPPAPPFEKPPKVKLPIDMRMSVMFGFLSGKAQRALLWHDIFTERDLARWTRQEVSELPGITPEAMPILERALNFAGMHFFREKPSARRPDDPGNESAA